MLQVAEVENADADLTVDARKIHKDNENMKISLEEDQEAAKHQKTLKVDSKNIAKTQKSNMEINI